MKGARHHFMSLLIGSIAFEALTRQACQERDRLGRLKDSKPGPVNLKSMPDYEPELVPSVDYFFFFLVLVIFAAFNSMKKYGDLRENFTSILGSQSKRGDRFPKTIIRQWRKNVNLRSQGQGYQIHNFSLMQRCFKEPFIWVDLER